MNAQGTAHELPAGRLASFEDDDADSGDLASILGARPRAAATAPQEPAATPTAPAAKKATRAPRKSPAKKSTAPKQETQPASIATPRTPAHSERANEIRSSSVHIPTAVLEKVVAYRDKHGMSNGQVVIAAIEYAHPRLPELIHPVTAGGGGLFAQRATRGVRVMDGPLTPLNVRLFAADYEVIDKLVEDLGAYSRGHLVTTSLTEFFDHND